LRFEARMKRRTSLWLVIALAATALGVRSWAAPVSELGAIIERARAATGAQEAGETIRVTGRGERLGTSGEYELIFDESGRFLRRLDAELPERVTWDGDRVWRESFFTGPYSLAPSESGAELLLMWTATGHWLSEDPQTPGGQTLVLSLGQPRPGAIVLDLSLGSLGEAELVLDPDTSLPRSLYLDGGRTRYDLLDYRKVGGLALPFTIRSRGADGAVTVYRGLEAETLDLGESLLERPAPRKSARFDAEVPATTSMATGKYGHLFVRPQVAGRDVGWFLLDTTATTSRVTLKTVQALGLSRVGEGDSTVRPSTRNLFHLATMTLGPMTMLDVVLEEAALDPELGAGLEGPMAGVIGWDLLARSVLELDVAAGELRLADPVGYELQDATWLSLPYGSRTPVLPLGIGGEEEQDYLCDTGIGGVAIVRRLDIQSRSPLLESQTTAESSYRTPHGIMSSRVGTLQSVELGGRRFDDQPSHFVFNQLGTAVSVPDAGHVGNGLLREFRVIFDLRSDRIALTRR